MCTSTVILDPDKIKIGYVILAAVPKPLVSKVQRKAGYGESSKWTHVAGSLGGLDAVEAVMPRSRVINLQKRYAERGIEIKEHVLPADFDDAELFEEVKV